MNAKNSPLSLVLLIGMVGVFVGERLIGAGSWRWVTAASVALVALSLGLRALRALKPGPAQSVERRLLAFYGLAALALVFYFVQSDLWAFVAGRVLERTSPKLATTLGALWPVLLVAAALPILLIEMAYASMVRAPRVEQRRLDDAALTGLGTAGALVFAFSVTYVASQRDHKLDLSYFRTARAGESTLKLAATLDQPIDVALFFPPANEVSEQVSSYFGDLQAKSKLVRVKNYDFYVDVGVAKQLGVTGNGIVVLSRDQRREVLSLGLQLEAARNQLLTFDRDVQRSLLKVARPTRTLYLTTGHGERSPNPTDDKDRRATVRDLRELLMQQGHSVRDLGPAEGLAVDVPQDASALLIIGPQRAFLPEEVASIERYAKRGGRILFAFDPDVNADFQPLLGRLGVKFAPALLANDQVYERRSFQASDRINLVTGSFSSHPSVTTLSHLGIRAPLIMAGAGSIEDVEPRSPELVVSPIVFSHQATFNDTNGNYEFDEKETRKTWTLGTSIVRRPPKAKKNTPDGGAAAAEASDAQTQEERDIVLADSDALADGVIGNPGNVYLVLDTVKWLLGEEAIAGEVVTETDVPVTHTRNEDKVWFYGSIFFAPALVLGIGYLATRRRSRSKRGVKEVSA